MENQDFLSELLNEFVDWEGRFYRLQKKILSEGLVVSFSQFELNLGDDLSYFQEQILNRQPIFADLLNKKILEIDTVVIQFWQRPEILKKICLAEDDVVEIDVFLNHFNYVWNGKWKDFNNKSKALTQGLFFKNLPLEFVSQIKESEKINFKIKVLKFSEERDVFEEALGLKTQSLTKYLDTVYSEDLFSLKFNPPQKPLWEKLLRMEIFGQKWQVDSSMKLEKVLTLISFRDLPVRSVSKLRYLMEHIDNYELTIPQLSVLVESVEDTEALQQQYFKISEERNW